MTDENITRSFIIDNYNLDKERRSVYIRHNKTMHDIYTNNSPLSSKIEKLEDFICTLEKKAEEFKNKFKNNKITDVMICFCKDEWNDIYISLMLDLIRPETDNEVIERLMALEQNKVELKRKKEKRYQQYLKLKEEFES